jgi:radical SAM superfamily enzyme YgiQ (UPF0313 family)
MRVGLAVSGCPNIDRPCALVSTRGRGQVRVLLISAVEESREVAAPLAIGLACVAAATERAGHDVRLLSFAASGEREFPIADAVLQFRPDVIGISARNIDDQNMQHPSFLLAALRELVAACRRVSSAPIVLGGAGYSIFPQPALTYLQADMGIKGEGEMAFPALLSWIEQGARGFPPAGTYLHNGLFATTASVPSLDTFPLPEPSLWLHFPGAEALRIPVQSRRGCPLDCIYCSTSAIEGRPVRKRSPETVVSWLAQLHTHGFRSFHFVDNTFNLPPSYAKDLCRKLIQAELGLDWWAIVYPKWVDHELADLMAKAGCTLVSLGFESGSEPVLKQLNKRFSCAEVKGISATFSAVGIKRNGFLLLGAPGETRETVEESLAFADSLHLDGLKVTVGLRIYPGTVLHSIAAAEGVVTADDDLLFPHFYLAAGVRDWLLERTAKYNPPALYPA